MEYINDGSEFLSRFNVCADTQEPVLNSKLDATCDTVAVAPDGRAVLASR